MTGTKSILVLGVGNILYTDEGLGVRAVQSLERNYSFSSNVRLLDGGTQGYLLMDAMMSCDTLIVLDAVRVCSKLDAVRVVDKTAVRVVDKTAVRVVDKNAVRVVDKTAVRVVDKNAVSVSSNQNAIPITPNQQATIHTFKGEDLRQSIAFSDSLHQTDLIDTLIMCELAGHRPDTIVIGMEPIDHTNQSLSLSAQVAAQMPQFCKTVLTAINDAGGQWQAYKQNSRYIQNAKASSCKP